MNIGDNVIYWVVGLVLLGLAIQLTLGYLAPEVRERRRRRNHRKVVSRARRPVVMLSAKVPKD
jgi:hypothetical protein